VAGSAFNKRQTMNSGSSPINYRPEIDGLRAVAVLAVVLYHAHLGISGGFIWVDVFFVISGYLITSLLLKDLEVGHLDLLAFWERRIRRILPAFAAVTAATMRRDAPEYSASVLAFVRAHHIPNVLGNSSVPGCPPSDGPRFAFAGAAVRTDLLALIRSALVKRKRGQVSTGA